MKHFRRLLPAICLLLISAMCAGTSTYAWFTLNEKVTATGMKVKASATGSLVIDKNPLSSSSKLTTIDFKMTSPTELKPCTYDDNKYKDISAATKAAVDPATGLATTTTLEVIADDALGQYVKSFVVYVGAQAQAVDGVIPSVTLSGVTSEMDKAVTAVIKQGSNNVGTIHGYDNNLTWTGSPFTAPLVASNPGVMFTVELYFDGAAKSGNVAYIHSQNMSLNDISIDMLFKTPNSQ